jgi:hypothetical protein
MGRLLAATALLLGLAGCSSGDWFHQEEPIKPEAPTNQSDPRIGPGPQSVPQHLSPAARTAAPPDSNVRPGELMDCVTESCKINCSSKVKKQFQPKWCARFKEPVLE